METFQKFDETVIETFRTGHRVYHRQSFFHLPPQNDPKLAPRPPVMLSCGQTHQSSFFSYQEHFLKVSSKSDERNSRCIENGIFWDQILPNLGPNDVHAQAIFGEHVTKLVSLLSFHTKNISSKFHQNLMKQIRDVLKTVYFGTKYFLIWAQMMGMPRQEWVNI